MSYRFRFRPKSGVFMSCFNPSDPKIIENLITAYPEHWHFGWVKQTSDMLDVIEGIEKYCTNQQVASDILSSLPLTKSAASDIVKNNIGILLRYQNLQFKGFSLPASYNHLANAIDLCLAQNQPENAEIYTAYYVKCAISPLQTSCLGKASSKWPRVKQLNNRLSDRFVAACNTSDITTIINRLYSANIKCSMETLTTINEKATLAILAGQVSASVTEKLKWITVDDTII